MDLVDEQHIPGIEAHQQADDVAGAFQGRSTGDAATHPQFLGQHQGHGGLAQARGAVEQHMVEGLTALAAGRQRKPQHLFQFRLTHVIGQSSRPQTLVATAVAFRRQGVGPHQPGGAPLTRIRR